MMGLAQIVALMLCISFAFLLAMPNPQAQGSSGSQNLFTKVNNVSSQIGSSAITIPISIPILGTPIFPNPFALFGGIATLLISLGTMSSDVIGSVWLPAPLALFLITTITITALIFAWSWWKGNNAA